jgi:hypothetical protein
VGTAYHQNWAVYSKRAECPENLTRVTGCKLAAESGLAAAHSTRAVSASGTSVTRQGGRWEGGGGWERGARVRLVRRPLLRAGGASQPSRPTRTWDPLRGK